MEYPGRLRRLIVFEGIDGAGTTTQARLLTNRIREAGHSVWSTSEPTESALGALLRQVLAGTVRVAPETVAYLFASDRYEHVFGSGGIVEHHDAGDVIVCDRYTYSSLVYQSVEADRELVQGLNAPFPHPGCLIFVDLDPSSGARRLAVREHREIYENQPFQERVRDSYLREIRSAGEVTTVISVSGEKPEAEVGRKIWEALLAASIL